MQRFDKDAFVAECVAAVRSEGNAHGAVNEIVQRAVADLVVGAIPLEVPPRWVRETSREVDTAVHEMTAAFLARNAAALRPDLDPNLAAFVLLRAGERVVESAVADAPDLFDREVLAKELLTMSLRYLYPEPSSS